MSVVKQGQLRLYRLDPGELKPVHDWVKQYERFWTHHLDRIKVSAESKVKDGLAQPSRATNKQATNKKEK